MSKQEPRKIGLIIGREWSWPSAFISEVNQRNTGVVAEFIQLGGTTLQDAPEYAVLIDRMSHEIPYYRAYLKYMALGGAYIINDPFTWSADDKFIGLALVQQLGFPTPPTVVLPNKRVETQTVPESFRNLVYPMDWKGIIDYVGVPAILKDIYTGGRRFARRVANVDDLIRTYDESDTGTVLLQQIIETDHHIHCFVFGGDRVRAVAYLRDADAYAAQIDFCAQELVRDIEAAAVEISRAYRYDMNMVEFVVHKDSFYVINASNPAPVIDIDQLPAEHFAWCVAELADVAIEKAQRSERRAGQAQFWLG